MKKSRILLVAGLAVIAAFGWGCARLGGKVADTTTSTNGKQDVVLDGNCSNAKYQYACYLDNAMAKNDPNACEMVGVEKRMDCLAAYQEIQGVPVECNVLTDATFRAECLKVLGSITSRNKEATVSATGTVDILNDQGLKVEQRQ